MFFVVCEVNEVKLKWSSCSRVIGASHIHQPAQTQYSSLPLLYVVVTLSTCIIVCNVCICDVCIICMCKRILDFWRARDFFATHGSSGIARLGIDVGFARRVTYSSECERNINCSTHGTMGVVYSCFFFSGTTVV